MTIRMKNHVRVLVERNISVEYSGITIQVVVDCRCFLLGERMRSGICVATWSSGCSFVTDFVLNQPVESPISVRIDTIAGQWHNRPRFAPVSVEISSVLVAVGIGDRQNVPVNVLRNLLNFRIRWAKQLVNDPSWSRWWDPFSGMNVRFDEHRSVVLQPF